MRKLSKTEKIMLTGATLDIITTLYFTQFLNIPEGNPFIRKQIQSYGTIAIPGTKIIAITILVKTNDLIKKITDTEKFNYQKLRNTSYLIAGTGWTLVALHNIKTILAYLL